MSTQQQQQKQQSSPSQEPTYSIQPHPAKTNDPAELVGGPQSGGVGAFQAPGPQIPSQEILNRLEKPKTREELRALAAELNKEQ
ncbi:hypothetical protein BC826DRAFT_1020633 [Russula brevipes]|nr:hypothetical protein BC826DRAFT_1020633 [Russula brevipes]